jgi:hypothetical protein
MTNFTDLYTTQTMSVTGTRERDVSDTIRHLFPGANFMPLISSGKVPTPEGVTQEKNLFGKRRVHSSKFEAFVQSPLTIEYTAVSLSSTDLTLAATAGLVAKYSLINTANGTTCWIDSVDDTTGLTVTSYGTTAFSVAADDILLVLSPHYEQKSGSPNILFNDPTNLLNYTFIFRFPVGISDTELQSQHYGGDRYMHIKRNNGAEAMRRCSNNLLFDNKPSSGETTTMGTAVSVSSCDGLYQWAQTETDFGGSMSFESFTQDMPLDWHESVGDSDPHLMWCGYKVWSVILGWQNDGTIQLKSGSYNQFGVQSMRMISARGWIEIMVLDAFNRGSFDSQALIVNPEKVDYVFLRNRDMQLKPNIQSRSVDGREDEIYGEISICPNDAGYSIHKLTNCVA